MSAYIRSQILSFVYYFICKYAVFHSFLLLKRKSKKIYQIFISDGINIVLQISTIVNIKCYSAEKKIIFSHSFLSFLVYRVYSKNNYLKNGWTKSLHFHNNFSMAILEEQQNIFWLFCCTVNTFSLKPGPKGVPLTKVSPQICLCRRVHGT